MKVAMIGASGRMGRAIISQLSTGSTNKVIAGAVQPSSPDIGKDIGTLAHHEELGVKAVATPDQSFLNADAVIDFSSPEATLATLEFYVSNKKKPVYVIGTTGFTHEQSEKIHAYGKKLPIIWSANMSIGVNILLGLSKQVASILDNHYDIEIIEAHHKHKVDAPSGTALALGHAVAEGRNVDLKETARKTRDGIIGPRKQGEIGFSTIRAADIIGEHTVMFATEGERIELTHKASDRTVFAKGAVRAASWGVAKKLKPGMYTMADVLF